MFRQTSTPVIGMKKRDFILIGTICLFLVFKGTRGAGCTGIETMGYPSGGTPNSVGKYPDGKPAGSGYIVPSTIPTYTSTCCGYVSEIDFFHENPGGTTKAQVWRPTSGTSYQLVGEITITGSHSLEMAPPFPNLVTSGSQHAHSIIAGSQFYTVPPASRIRVQTGDVVGWYSASANVMSYKNDPPSDDTLYQVFATAPVLNSIVNWGTATALADRFYAIQYYLAANVAPIFTNLPTTTTTTNGATVNTLMYTIAVTDSDVLDQTNLTVTRMDTNSYFSYDSVTKEVKIATALAGAVGTHLLVFQVTDFCMNSGTSTLTISVTNVPPTIQNLPNSTSLSENTYVSTLLHKLIVTDPTDTVSCSLATTGTPFSVQTISGCTDYGIYSQANPGFSYDTQIGYTLSIACTDGYDTATGTYTVCLLRNQASVITNLTDNWAFFGPIVGALSSLLLIAVISLLVISLKLRKSLRRVEQQGRVLICTT